jgi:hypothetical protein
VLARRRLGRHARRVRQNYVLGEFGTPKSRRSSRSVPMADAVGAELERLYQARGEPGDDELVFAVPAPAAPMSNAAVLRRHRKALKAAHLHQSHVATICATPSGPGWPPRAHQGFLVSGGGAHEADRARRSRGRVRPRANDPPPWVRLQAHAERSERRPQSRSSGSRDGRPPESRLGRSRGSPSAGVEGRLPGAPLPV